VSTRGKKNHRRAIAARFRYPLPNLDEAPGPRRRKKKKKGQKKKKGKGSKDRETGESHKDRLRLKEVGIRAADTEIPAPLLKTTRAKEGSD